MTEQRFDRINALAKLNSAQKYLEIGVFKGTNFKFVEVLCKVGVDPKFLFDTSAQAGANVTFYEVTSDYFFAKLAAHFGKFDLIYLDGLHTFEQTFRDFCASLAYAHERTLWLIDDTGPVNWFSSFRNRKLAGRLRRVLRARNHAWMGDVYKTVFAIHDFFPQYSYATFDERNQTVVWLEPRPDFAPTWNSLAAISHISFRGFQKYKVSHLAVMPPADLLARVECALSKGQRGRV